jgi:hypothetical protein
MTFTKIIFTKEDEKKGYPFFSLSLFSAWISYKNNPTKNFTRWSIETATTISQLIGGHKTEIILDRQIGYENLKLMLERNADKINFARIYPNKNFAPITKHEFYFEIKKGVITKNEIIKVGTDKINIDVLDKNAIRIIAINDEQIIFNNKK